MAVDDREPAEGDEPDIADEVSYADTGRPWGARAIRHPSHAATRRYLKTSPLPKQTRRTS
ncbi:MULTISPECIES: hypothetical protein [unclassified Streptomyces]|uniref:hypothetical protein n=1 Tax=unclassified Streptomyces TaxID=2593676 RepID=UPI000DDB8A12|nr:MULTISPECIES: hypothetical protein [unclassified Streptomyces]QZZ26580.1 hypothetical protein A7X85_10200 [Streptomyces sp. ST1015]